MMLGLLLLQLAVAAPETLTAISVHDGDRHTRVAIHRIDRIAMLPVGSLAASFGGVVRRDAPDRYRVTMAGLELDFTPGAALVRSGSQVVPLPTAAHLKGVELFVPLAFVSDVLPRLAPEPGITFDASRGELRRASAKTAATAVAPAPVRPAPAPVRAPARPVVVIDPGHGGPDRGMRGPLRSSWKINEADITLQIGKRLRDVLAKSGVEVVMTRTTDTLIALADRGRIANDRKADLFISLHVNAANPRWRNPGNARGFETYFLSEARTEDARRVEELENSSIEYEVEVAPVNGDALSFILKDMRANESLRESQLLADALQTGLGTIHPGPSRGVKQAGFRVLVAALVPAVLVEVGFGSNLAEARYLASAAGQQAIASALAQSTLGYLAAYGRRRAQGDTTH
jgi:N-acetylmuramoyl-L-alanine amidase